MKNANKFNSYGQYSLLFFFSLFFSLLSFHSLAQTNTGKKTLAEHWYTSSFNVAIFPSTYIVVDGYKSFTPSKDEIDLAERAFSREFTSMNRKREMNNEPIINYRRLSRYNRQYFGYYNDAGEKILLIYAFWREGDVYSDERNWLNEYTKPTESDGKTWSIEFNINQKILFDFYVPKEDSQPINRDSIEIGNVQTEVEPSDTLK